MFDNTGGGGLVEIEKPPYLVVSTTPKIKRGMPWKVRRKENTAQMTTCCVFQTIKNT